jgi:hypothetical protein
VTIAYAVDAQQVAILGVYYGGQDLAAGWADDEQQH